MCMAVDIIFVGQEAARMYLKNQTKILATHTNTRVLNTVELLTPEQQAEAGEHTFNPKLEPLG